MTYTLLPLLLSATFAPPMLLVPTTGPEARSIDARLRVAADLTFLDEATTASVLEDGRALGLACDGFDVACFAKLGSLAEAERVVTVIVSDNGADGVLVIVNVVDVKSGEVARRTAQVPAGATTLIDVAVYTARAAILGDEGPVATDPPASLLPPAVVRTPPVSTPPVAAADAPAPAPAASSSTGAGLPPGMIVGGTGLALGAIAGIGAGSMELLLASPSGKYEERGGWQWVGRGLTVAAGVGLVVAGVGFAWMAAD